MNNLWRILNKIFLASCSLSSLGILIWAIVGIIQLSSLPVSQSYPDFPLDLVPLLVALGFWVVGMAVWIAGQRPAIVTFFFISSASLAVGLLSGFENDLAGRLFYIFIAWLAPVLFQFHIVWALLPKKRLERAILIFLYLLAFAWSLPFLLNPIAELQGLGWFPFLRLGVRLTIAFSLVVVIILLISQFFRASQPTTRYRIRLVFSGTVLAFAPLLLLSLLPNLLGAVFIPHEVNFVWLLFIPLSYGYSMTGQTFRFERVLDRIIVYYLAAVLFGGGYLIAADIFIHFIPGWANFWAWAIAGLGLLLLFLLVRVNHLIRQIANWIFYGSEKSHLELLAQMTESLGPVLNRGKLREILVDELASTVPLAGIALFLKTREGSYALHGLTGFDWQAPEKFSLPESGSLAAFLKGQGAIVEKDRVQKALTHAILVPEELELLSIRNIGLWIPLISGDEMHGLLVLGLKPGGVLFNTGERRVLFIFAHQAGVAAHNLLLAEDLQFSRDELARAHQQLLYAREQEQHQLACELHDNAVQQLLGISYQIVSLQQRIRRFEANGAANLVSLHPGLDALRQEILGVTTQLREMIGELRPAGLEEFGLGSALEGFVHKMQRQPGRACPQIEMEIEQNGYKIPEPVSTCLFRVSQEALRNILKHANAQNVKLHLSNTENEVFLEIFDDGSGFHVPNRLSELTQTDHFGLVGMAERVAWVNGQFQIRSQPGLGTRLLVRIPF